jgi:D-xylose transport system substrate-binding protein
MKTNSHTWSFTFILTLLLVFVISSCTQLSTKKVAFLYPNFVNERYKKEEGFFTKKIQELGGEAMSYDAQNNDQLQIDQAIEAIDKGADVLVVNVVNQNTAAAIVRAGKDANVPVIAYDRIIKNCDLDFYISFDNEKVGKLMAEAILKQKPSGSYVILNGDKSDQNAIWVNKGIYSVLKPDIESGKVKVDFDMYIEDWLGTNAQFEFDRYLRYATKQPDAVITSYDGLALGAIQALKKYNLQGVAAVSGQDAELAACQNIVKGYQTVTIYKPFKTQAEMAAQFAMKLVNGEKIDNIATTINNGRKEVPSILIEPIAVDASNIRETIIKDGFFKEEEVFNN